MFSRVFGGGGAKGIPLVAGSPAKLSYKHSVCREHMDENPHHAVVLVHDYGKTGASLNNFTGTVGTLCAKGVSLSCPLELYAPDMRCHGKSPKAKGSYVAVSCSEYANDLLHFADTVVDSTMKIHVIGFGWGAQVAAAAALSNPTRFVSLGMVNYIPPLANPELRNAALHRLELMLGCAGASTMKELDALLTEKGVKNPLARAQLLLSASRNAKKNGAIEWDNDLETLRGSIADDNVTDVFNFPVELGPDAAPSANIPTTIVSDRGFSDAQMQACKALFPKVNAIPKSDFSLDVLTGEAAEYATMTTLSGAGLLKLT